MGCCCSSLEYDSDDDSDLPPAKKMSIPHLMDDDSAVPNPLFLVKDTSTDGLLLPSIPATRPRAPTIEDTAPHIHIERFKSKFEVGREMGQGAFSIVYEGRKFETGDKYALKCLRKAELEQRDIEALCQEIDLLKQLNHPYVMNLEGVYQDDYHYIISSELFEGGDLLEHLVESEFYSEADAQIAIRAMLEAIDYCHSRNVVHRDLKLENIMLANSAKQIGDIKIIDFGFAKQLQKKNERRSSCCGTPSFGAPELRTDDDFDPKPIDIWALGCIAFILLCGWPPFDGADEDELDQNIVDGELKFDAEQWENVTEMAKSVVRQMLIHDPIKRPTARQLLEHQWFAGPKKEVSLMCRQWRATVNLTPSLSLICPVISYFLFFSPFSRTIATCSKQ
jgi:calcium/calmodulin-dependent protein kinase I